MGLAVAILTRVVVGVTVLFVDIGRFDLGLRRKDVESGRFVVDIGRSVDLDLFFLGFSIVLGRSRDIFALGWLSYYYLIKSMYGFPMYSIIKPM